MYDKGANSAFKGTEFAPAAAQTEVDWATVKTSSILDPNGPPNVTVHEPAKGQDFRETEFESWVDADPVLSIASIREIIKRT